MIRIIVVLSTYNGERFLKRQLDSIFEQEGVNVTCYLRDDCSKDGTVDLARKYSKAYDLIVETGDNLGHQRSFMKALHDAPEGDFYAFADQDDIWFPKKLKNAVEKLKPYGNKLPVMYHCNRISVNEDLTPLQHQMKRVGHPLNRENALSQEYAQGCTIVMNGAARNLILRYQPEKKYYHDYWTGMLCYLFGIVIYDERPQMYHISYGTNTSTEGHLVKGWLQRFSFFFNRKEVYYAPAKELMDGYADLLSDDDKNFLKKVIGYKHNFAYKLYLLFSPKYRREGIFGTISLKIAILFNKI